MRGRHQRPAPHLGSVIQDLVAGILRWSTGLNTDIFSKSCQSENESCVDAIEEAEYAVLDALYARANAAALST